MFSRKSLFIAAVLAALILMWLVSPSRGVLILAYHKISDEPECYSVSPAEFAKQLHYLAQNGYTAITLQEMFEGFAGTRKLPDKPFVLTFDDGYEDNYLAALPIMKQYGMKGTVFVIGQAVGHPSYMTWQQLQSMLEQGMEIGSHTYSHVALNQLSAEERQRELTQSKTVLEQHLHRPVEFLAYPFGQYDASLLPQVQSAGYRGACSGVPGLNFAADNPYLLKRANVPRPRWGMWEFRLRLWRANLVSKFS